MFCDSSKIADDLPRHLWYEFDDVAELSSTVDDLSSLVDDGVEGGAAGGVDGRDEQQAAAQLREVLHVQRRLRGPRHLDRVQLETDKQISRQPLAQSSELSGRWRRWG